MIISIISVLLVMWWISPAWDEADAERIKRRRLTDLAGRAPAAPDRHTPPADR